MGLDSVLALKPGRKITDAAATIPDDIWHLANLTKHVTAVQEKDGHKVETCPDVTAAQDPPENMPRHESDTRHCG